jgi:hypothetical protein
MKSPHLFFLGLCLSLLTCKAPNVANTSVEKCVLSQFTMLPAPNDLDSVGFVFAVDKNKTQLPITYIDVKVMKSGAELKNCSENRNVTYGALLDFVAAEQASINVDATIDRNRTINSTIALEGVKFNRTLLLDMNANIQAKKKEIQAFIKNQPENKDLRYFLIVEAYKASKLKYKFDKDVTADAGFKASFENVATLNPSAKWNVGKEFQLEYELPKELNVFVKVYELKIKDSLVGEPAITIAQSPTVESSQPLYDQKAN